MIPRSVRYAGNISSTWVATRRFSSEGLTGFIQKPFRQQDLQDIIGRVLRDNKKTST